MSKPLKRILELMPGHLHSVEPYTGGLAGGENKRRMVECVWLKR